MPHLQRDDYALGSLVFFPKGEPDETFRSLIARYSILNSIESESILLRKIFQRACQNDRIYTEDLEILSGLVASIESAEDFYSRTLSENTFHSLIFNFMDKNGSDSFTRERDRIDLYYLTDHRFCVSCLERDYESIGFTYWRRSHQVPGIVCCWEHSTLLNQIPNAQTSLRMSRLLFDSEELWAIRELAAQKIADEEDVQYAIFVKDALSMKPIGSISVNKILFPHSDDPSSILSSRLGSSRTYSFSNGGEAKEMASRLLVGYKKFKSVDSMTSLVMGW